LEFIIVVNPPARSFFDLVGVLKLYLQGQKKDLAGKKIKEIKSKLCALAS
jgi:hypothetical protein